MTDEKRDAIYRAYGVETRRGADTLFWEDVVVGVELKTVIVKFATFDDEVNAWKRRGAGGKDTYVMVQITQTCFPAATHFPMVPR